MGLTQSSQAETKYLKLKAGKFYVGKDESTGYSELEGTVTDIYTKVEEFTDQIKGKVSIEKLYVKLDDGTENYILGLRFDSAEATSLIGFLKSADLSQPLILIPLFKREVKDGVEKENRRILVKQAGNFVKAYYTRENPNGLPQMIKKENKRAGTVEWDKSDMMDFYATVVEKELKPNVATEVTASSVGDNPLYKPSVISKPTSAVVTSGSYQEIDDQLPF